MKFLVDAHLPKKLSVLLNYKGYDSIHTLDLPDKNRTKDSEINQISISQQRVLISKDADFIESLLISNKPYKLICISTGNITNKELLELFAKHIIEVDIVLDPYSAYDKAYEKTYDLYLFDINLPFESGIEALKSLKDSGDATPTIFITSRDDKASLVDGFNAGADDYIRKPVDLDELLLRINAVLKRVSDNNSVTLGEYILDREQKDLIYKGKHLKLGFKLYLLLELLVDNNEKAVSYEDIYSKLWGKEEPNHATIRVYIVKLKKFFPKAIESIRGYGYIFHKDRV